MNTKLTAEQSRLVEENHNLIYGVINTFGLDIEEYYDLMALELCYTVMKYDSSRGALSSYYYLRCKSLIKKEHKKKSFQKNANNGISSLEKHFNIAGDNNIDEYVSTVDMFDGEYGEYIKLKSDGYNQQEIADLLGVTQSYVSKILRKEREKSHD